MLTQIAIGAGLIVISVVIAAALMGAAFGYMHRITERLVEGRVILKNAIALSGVTLSLVMVMTIVMWMWAVAFRSLGVFSTFEEALYFSMVSFTTLGFGDVLAPQEWRLLSGFVATAGFILFGVATAFLFEALSEIRKAHNHRRDVDRQPARPR